MRSAFRFQLRGQIPGRILSVSFLVNDVEEEPEKEEPLQIHPLDAAVLHTRLKVALEQLHVVAKTVRHIASPGRLDDRPGGAAVADELDEALLQVARLSDKIGAYTLKED